eukprot:Amastigsp_a677350_26.p2 type:complete len:133 gc:universal Amastigsp_a677350_26:658-260(-)
MPELRDRARAALDGAENGRQRVGHMPLVRERQRSLGLALLGRRRVFGGQSDVRELDFELGELVCCACSHYTHAEPGCCGGLGDAVKGVDEGNQVAMLDKIDGHEQLRLGHVQRRLGKRDESADVLHHAERGF